MIDLFEPYTKKFNPISLDELNARAALLDREENKYLLTTEEFIDVLADLRDKFDILTIDDDTVFSYKSTYFDSDNFIAYNYHHQERNNRRFKVRTRHYVDSDLCFFEVKLKNKRGGTIKKRIPYSTDDYGTMTPEAVAFLRKTYEEVYGYEFNFEMLSKMEVSYSRITLVAKAGGERMTIDFNLGFENDEYVTPIRSMLIAETKSSNGRGIADAVFKKHGIKSQSCSKYCLGANLLQYNVKYNRFKPLLKLYSKLPIYSNTPVASKTAPQPVRRPRMVAGQAPTITPASAAAGRARATTARRIQVTDIKNRAPQRSAQRRLTVQVG